MEPLKPCPFCDGEPMLQEHPPHEHGLEFGGFKMPDHPGNWTIECCGCQVGMIGDTREEAVGQWNRRPAGPSLSSPTRGVAGAAAAVPFIACHKCGGFAQINDGDDGLGPPVCTGCYDAAWKDPAAAPTQEGPAAGCCASSHSPPTIACDMFLDCGDGVHCVYCVHEKKCHSAPAARAVEGPAEHPTCLAEKLGRQLEEMSRDPSAVTREGVLTGLDWFCGWALTAREGDPSEGVRLAAKGALEEGPADAGLVGEMLAALETAVGVQGACGACELKRDNLVSGECGWCMKARALIASASPTKGSP